MSGRLAAAGRPQPAEPSPPPAHPISVKAVALPPEHGAWGFLFEPILLGMVVAPSGAGVAIAVAALGAFLSRHPLKLLLGDWSRGRRYPRTRLAARFALVYGLAAVAGLGLALAEARAAFWWPLALAAPLGVAQLHYDSRNRGRDLLPELLGSMAPGSVASAMALARGWAPGSAFALWLILASRAVASTLYVRSRLRLDRGQPHDAAAVWASHLASLLIVGFLASAGWAPWVALPVFAALLGRAVHGLSWYRAPVRPQTLGLTELTFGLVTAVLVAFGYVRTGS